MQICETSNAQYCTVTTECITSSHPSLTQVSSLTHSPPSHPSLTQVPLLTHPGSTPHSSTSLPPLNHPAPTHHSPTSLPSLTHLPPLTHPPPSPHSPTSHPSLTHLPPPTHSSLFVLLRSPFRASKPCNKVSTSSTLSRVIESCPINQFASSFTHKICKR